MRVLRYTPLLVLGLVLPLSPAFAQNFWHISVPPDSVVRWRPLTAREAALTPGRDLETGLREQRPLALSSSSQATSNDSAEWIPLVPMGTRFHHDSALDAATHRVVVFGGWGDPASPAAPELVIAYPLGSNSAWEALGTGSAESPVARFASSVAVDPVHHSLLVFGGQATDGTGVVLGDLWSLSLEPGGTWTRLTPAGPAPQARRFASLFYDAPRTRFILAGGYGDSPLPEFWELRLDPAPAWRPLVFANPESANLGAVLGDPIRGDAWSVAWENEIHHLSIGTDVVTADTALAVEPDPSRWGAPSLMLAGLDPFARRLLWFGYQSGGPTYARMNQVRWFTLDSSHALEQVAVAGTAPADRYLFASNWDADGARLVITGGYDDEAVYFGDAWQLAMPLSIPTAVAVSLRRAESDTRGVRLAWTVGQVGGARGLVQRSADGAAWSDAGDARWSSNDELAWDGPALAASAREAFRLVVAPGENETITAAVWMNGPADDALALAPLSNPAGRDLSLRLSLRSGAPARLRVLDASGRVVAQADLPAGSRAWSFGRPAVPGLYFAELTQGGERRVTKLVTLR